MESRQVSFSILRDSYQTVKSFIEHESGFKVESLDTKIEKDLLMSGDDNYELIEKFVDKFNLKYDGFDYLKHFESEGELTGDPLYGLLKLIVWIPFKAMELISFNKLKILEPDFWGPSRKTLDLSFRDMLTWYVERKYKLSSEIKYELKAVS